MELEEAKRITVSLPAKVLRLVIQTKNITTSWYAKIFFYVLHFFKNINLLLVLMVLLHLFQFWIWPKISQKILQEKIGMFNKILKV